MRFRKNDRGVALVFAMIAIGVLMAIVATSLQRSTVDTKLAGSFTKRTLASEVAETGLGRVARLVLDRYKSAGSINSLLGTVQLGTSSGGQYGVVIADNSSVGGIDQDGDGSNNTDRDGIFRLVSTGQIGNSEQVLEAFYKVVASAQPPQIPASGGIGAVGLCGNNFDIGPRSSRISGQDYVLPGYPCLGAGCNGSVGTNPPASGIAYNAATTVSLTGGDPTGNPPVNSNAGIDCDAWANFAANAEAVAQTTLSASAGPFNTGSYAFGTDIAPKVILIQGNGETAQFNGNLFGNGVLIIRNCHVVFNGTFTYAGLILIEDNGGGITVSGSSQTFGSMVVLNATAADAQTEITIQSNSTRVLYSTQGLGRAQTALNGTSSATGGNASLQLVAWRASSE